MPAADITEVTITFGNGIKREEYGPVKKAEVTIRAIVNQGEDGVIALNYISRIAEAKCKELLLGTAAPAADTPLPPISAGSPASPSEDAAAPGEPQRRKRRTQAEIAADAAAAATAQSTSAIETAAVDPTSAAQTAAANSDTSGSATSASPASAAATPGQPELSPPSTDGVVDEWDVGAADAPTITDLELNHSCSETAGRTKKPLDVKALIGTFAPATDEFNVEKGGRKFTVNDIPQNQRADFIAKLKALT